MGFARKSGLHLFEGLGKKPLYLALLTDVFSRFIVGCEQALRQAIKQANGANLRGLIHHSDHGGAIHSLAVSEPVTEDGDAFQHGRSGQLLRECSS